MKKTNAYVQMAISNLKCQAEFFKGQYDDALASLKDLTSKLSSTNMSGTEMLQSYVTTMTTAEENYVQVKEQIRHWEKLLEMMNEEE